MKISTTLGYDGDPVAYARKAKDLESAGVDLVWSGEIYGFDLVSSLAYLAATTTTLELMTGIITVAATMSLRSISRPVIAYITMRVIVETVIRPDTVARSSDLSARRCER